MYEVKNLVIIRSQDEIVARLKFLDEMDWMGTMRLFLALYLDYDHAKIFLKESTTREEWEKEEFGMNTPKGDTELRADFYWFLAHCHTWITDGNYEMHRVRGHLVNLLWLAGLPEADDIGFAYHEGMAGGLHQETAYNVFAVSLGKTKSTTWLQPVTTIP